jgi:hypothetical protein
MTRQETRWSFLRTCLAVPRVASCGILASALASVALAACGTSRSEHRRNYTYQQARLGRSQGADSEGFGSARPAIISFGGDPTSVVSDIHWQSWGGAQAVGDGMSTWVWPGTCTGCNRPSQARVVAFDLGRCNGMVSYLRLEWYFPEYGDTFSAARADRVCSQTPGADVYESPPRTTRCPPSPMFPGAAATEVTIEKLTCSQAARLLSRIPAGSYRHERRLIIGRYRCGTEGAAIGATATMSCGFGSAWVSFTISPS